MYNQFCPVCDQDDRVIEVAGGEGIMYCKRCNEHFEQDEEVWLEPPKTRKTKLKRESDY
jgi:uncharacterized protein YbaR (Trm112 family)